MEVSAPHVLVGAAVSTLASGHTVALGAEVVSEALLAWSDGPAPWVDTHSRLLLHDLLRLVEILGSVVGGAKRGPVEIVKH